MAINGIRIAKKNPCNYYHIIVALSCDEIIKNGLYYLKLKMGSCGRFGY
jgi:hypothetical protein